MASIPDMITANQLGEDLSSWSTRLPLLGGLHLHTDREVLARLCACGDYARVTEHYPEVLRAMDEGRKAIEQLGGRAGHIIFINGCVQVLPTRQYANVVGVVNFSRDLMSQGAAIEGRLEVEAGPAPETRLQHASSSETGLSIDPPR
jgi:hypothetical protein